jgi:predicted NBD/HSP70 family sugar kinase
MYILFDIGGTKTRIAVSKDGKRFGRQFICNTPKSFDSGMKKFDEGVRSFTVGKKIRGIAGGIAGPLNRAQASLVNSPNLRGWVDKPLKAYLEKKYRALAMIENDADIVGLGEATYGAGRDYAIVAYITISTGIGGVRIVDGAIDHSARGFEPGHHVIDVNKGSRGSWEHLASGKAMQQRYRKHPGKITKLSVWRKEARLLAYGLNNVIVFWSPDVIILGGGVALGRPGLIRDVREQLRNAVKIFPSVPPIKKALLKDVGGLYGALALVKERF